MITNIFVSDIKEFYALLKIQFLYGGLLLVKFRKNSNKTEGCGGQVGARFMVLVWVPILPMAHFPKETDKKRSYTGR